MSITVQRLKKGVPDQFALAERYYRILSVLNDLDLTEREVQLIAFTAVRGNISYSQFREEFCQRHGTSAPTINNMISRLKKTGVLIKDNGKIKVNPVLVLKFNEDVTLQIRLVHEEARDNTRV